MEQIEEEKPVRQMPPCHFCGEVAGTFTWEAPVCVQHMSLGYRTHGGTVDYVMDPEEG